MSQKDRQTPDTDTLIHDDFENLIEQMNTPESIAAVDSLFDMTGEELGSHHAPGRTERQAER